jgi:hypothetical protein
LLGLAVGDDVVEPISDGMERIRVGGCGCVCRDFAGECFILPLEGFEACVEGVDALPEARGVERSL